MTSSKPNISPKSLLPYILTLVVRASKCDPGETQSVHKKPPCEENFKKYYWKMHHCLSFKVVKQQEKNEYMKPLVSLNQTTFTA